jgi:hypothetical protein
MMRATILILCLCALPLGAHAQPKTEKFYFHSQAMDLDTGALALRSGERLYRVAADDSWVELPHFPRKQAYLQLLLLSDKGLWVRDKNRFGFFRPGPRGWSQGDWLLSDDYPSRELVEKVHTVDQESPALLGPDGKLRLRLVATEDSIEERPASGLPVPEPQPSPSEHVRLDAAAQRCVVDPWPGAPPFSPALPDLTRCYAQDCKAEVLSTSGRLWLHAGYCLVGATQDGWSIYEAGDGRMDMPEREDTSDHWQSRRLWLAGGLVLGGALAAGSYATPESVHRVPFARTLVATAGAWPMVRLLGDGLRSRHGGAHDYGFIFLFPAAVLVSPLPALTNAAVGALGRDGAQHRARGGLAAFGATWAGAAVAMPLAQYLAARVPADQRPLVELMASCVIGLASSIAYSYAAKLPH